MAQLAASYYVSAVQAKGSTGSLAGLTVYPFSDVSVFSTDGSPVKTVAADDVVGLLNDGTYALVKNCTLPAGSAGYTVLRGAKSSDGSFDTTRATRPQITLGAYRVTHNAANICLADLFLTGATGNATASLVLSGSSADRNLLYNLKITKGAGTTTTDAGVSTATGANDCAMVGCLISGFPGAGVAFGSGSGWRFLYNEFSLNTTGGWNSNAASPSTVLLAHNVAFDNSGDGFNISVGSTGGFTVLHNSSIDNSADGFYFGTIPYHSMVIGNLAAGNGSHGFDAGSASNLRHLMARNAAYNNTSGDVGVSGNYWPVYEAWTSLSALTLTTYTPTAATGMITLGELIQSETTGRNDAGALTQSGTGGGTTGGGRGGIFGPMGGGILNFSQVGG